ncbi:MAG: hypothetical protein HC769_31235 [Cyanobacteria bacterium CRU_2_1]|nr:hypothetical protein [Cyanobacteria bacterium CRU_2_1]
MPVPQAQSALQGLRGAIFIANQPNPLPSYSLGNNEQRSPKTPTLPRT